ncbi:MAG TPA: DUF2911 domain-containing protein [Bacteroidota bacterium]|nr:DUF2911 domain-containing protein [Bacteroidota bacterium]
MKNTFRTFCLCVSAAVLLLCGSAIGQQKSFQISPAATVMQTVGVTDMTVVYHRPGVKGRVIWGGLVPYDKVWRAGANEATMVTFSDDVTVAGTVLKAGSYSFFVIPTHGDWTVIFNAQPQWGAFRYDSTKDALRCSVKPQTTWHEEWLSYSFSDLTASSVKLVLHWEKMSVAVPIEVNTEAALAKASKNAVSMSWQAYNNYGLFCLNSKSNLDKGLEAVEKSIAISENASNLRMKAELLAQSGKVDDAIATAQKAITVGKAANPHFDPSEIDELLDQWKRR